MGGPNLNTGLNTDLNGGVGGRTLGEGDEERTTPEHFPIGQLHFIGLLLILVLSINQY